MVIETGSVTAAAERAKLSPGAVSQQLRKLSNELAEDLFARAGRRLVATPAGLRLAEHVRGILHHIENLRQEFGPDPDFDGRPLHLASGGTTLIHRMGPALRALRKRLPHTPIRVTVTSTEDMVEGLVGRRFDVAVISLPVQDARLTIWPLFEEEFLFLEPAPRPVVAGWRVGQTTPSALAGRPFLLYPPDSNMRALQEEFFQTLAVKPDVVMEAADTEVIVRLVESGFGTSLMPEYALRRSPRHFRVLRVKGHRLVRTQAVAVFRSTHPRPLAAAVASLLISYLAQPPFSRSKESLFPI